MLDQLQKGQYDQILRLIALQTSVHCPKGKSSTSPLSPTKNEAPKAIMCGDGDDMSNQTMPEFEEYLELLESQSYAAGAIWATFRLICTGWRVRSRWRYTGPFGGNTSIPILWIGNTADPVTPIRNAHNMAKSFHGSAAVQQDSEGHCSL
jgi:pimeloyl-ACP methyl ester carboxylesterase